MRNNIYWPIRFTVIPLLLFWGCKPQQDTTHNKGLKDVLNGKFYIGTALSKDQILGGDSAAISIVKQHFNSIVAENCMKVEKILPRKGEYDFSVADKFVDFGEQNNMFIIGHTLVWHSQTPDWFFTDDNGNDVSRDELIQRMKKHISTVVGRYKGRVDGWDVVNEAMENDGSFRQSKYYKIIGPEYIKLAFQFAHEADSGAQLYYNDYAMTLEEKQDGVMKMLQSLQKDGITIHGIGMQGHINLNKPPVEQIEKSILRLSALGIPIMITELDMTVIPWPGTDVTADVALSVAFKKEFDPYPNGLPDSVNKQFNDKYYQLFKMFEKHSDKISRVTLWGINDQQSWRNYWPIDGRTDYPLLFDRSYHPKPAVTKLINE